MTSFSWLEISQLNLLNVNAFWNKINKFSAMSTLTMTLWVWATLRECSFEWNWKWFVVFGMMQSEHRPLFFMSWIHSTLETFVFVRFNLLFASHDFFFLVPVVDVRPICMKWNNNVCWSLTFLFIVQMHL